MKILPHQVKSRPAKPGKALSVAAMKNEIQKTMGSLGVSISFDADKALSKLRRGAILRLGDLKKLPVGTPVWVFYKEHGSSRPRINSAMRLTAPSGGAYGLEDGSSFAADFDIAGLKDIDDCREDKCGEGEMVLYRAVP